MPARRRSEAEASVSSRLQHDDVLPRQDVDHPVDLKPVGAELLADLRHAHLVNLADGHSRVLEPELDQHQPPVRLERLTQLAHEDLRRRQLVVHVDHHDQIERRGRQDRVVGAALDERDVGQALARRPSPGSDPASPAAGRSRRRDRAGQRLATAARCSSRSRRRRRRPPTRARCQVPQSPLTALPRPRARAGPATPRPRRPSSGQARVR